MLAAVKLVLAVCVATRLRLARCQSGEADPGSRRPHPQCDEDTLRMLVRPSLGRPFHIRRFDNIKNNNEFAIPYGASVIISCSLNFSAARLTLTRDGEKLLTENDIDAIWVKVTILELQKSVYACNDDETGCQLSMIISVTPELKVISNYSDSTRDRLHVNYTIEYGNPINVSCYTPATSRLVMTKDGEKLITERESENNIMYLNSQPDLQISKYVCTDVRTKVNSWAFVKVVPLLYIQSRNETISSRYVETYQHDFTQDVSIEYNESIEVGLVCCGSGAVQLVSPDVYFNDKIVVANKTTVNLFIENFNLSASTFICTDRENENFKSILRVKVAPRLDVISPFIRREKHLFGVIIKNGVSVDIFCSWFDAADLKVYLISTLYTEQIRELAVQTINSTALKYQASFNALHGTYALRCLVNDEVLSQEHFHVMPEAINFHCVSYMWQYLNCTWKVSSYDVNYSLYYIKNRVSTSICIQTPTFLSKSEFRLCTWEYPSLRIDEFSLLLQSCGGIGCYNQTFRLDHESIVKLPSPKELRVIRTSAHGATMFWSADLVHFVDEFFVTHEYFHPAAYDVLYKVVYWYPGIYPREVNASLVSCNYPHCEIHLTLPCPNTFYEVQVYQKLKTAIGEEFWSDPSTVKFVTDVENNQADDIDSTCLFKPHKNKEVMKYFVQELRQEVVVKMTDLKRKVKEKLALIRDLRKQLTDEL